MQTEFTQEVRQRIESGEKITAVDCFCGAGGLSLGLKHALQEIADGVGESIEEIANVHAINHDPTAIESHKANFPFATHYQRDINAVEPGEVVDHNERVDILIAAPDCTYHSTARGGGPKDRASRNLPYSLMSFIRHFNLKTLLVEIVPEVTGWGPLDEDGHLITEQKGEHFKAWKQAISVEMSAVEHKILNCADYGDATARKRFFLLATDDGGVSWPTPTHSEHGTGDTEVWRGAEQIIDWSDVGDSLWTRDLYDGRRKPLSSNTMKRIARGFRMHAPFPLSAYASVVEQLEPDDIYALRDRVVPREYAPTVAELTDKPFLVPSPDNGNETILCHPSLTQSNLGSLRDVSDSIFLLRQQSGGNPPTPAEPLPTISTAGAISMVSSRLFSFSSESTSQQNTNDLPLPASSLERLTETHSEPDATESRFEPYIVPFNSERKDQLPRVHSIKKPTPTVVASKVFGGLCTPFIIDYYNVDNSTAYLPSQPLPTQAKKDRFALVSPRLWPYGLDIRFRMLTPEELATAHSFPPNYTIKGTKTETVAQIGNSVPVRTGTALIRELLVERKPTIDQFTSLASTDTTAD